MKSYTGDAIVTTITADIDSGDTTIAIAASSGWPSGAGGKPFVVEVRDDTGHEKVLVASRSGTTLTVSSRGFDGTVARAFLSGSAIKHVWDADSATEFSEHIGDDTDPDDPHASTLLNEERHADPAFHEFGSGNALGVPGTPAKVSTAANQGSGDNPAREDHVHDLDPAVAGDALAMTGGVLRVVADDATLTITGDTIIVKAGGIDTAQLASQAVESGNLAPDAVIAGKIAADAVRTGDLAAGAVDETAVVADNIITNAKLTALSVSRSKFVADTEPIQVVANATARTSLTAVEGMVVIEKDTDRVWEYNGSAWVYLTGGSQPLYAARMHRASAYTSNNEATDVVPFDTVTYDYNSNCVTGAAASYTVPVTGLYQISGSLTFGFNNARQRALLYWYQGATARHVVGLTEGATNLTTNDPLGMAFADCYPLTAGDVIQMRLYVGGSSGNDVSVANAYFAIRKV
jgi:hypothetical protein